jgi:hypothetical protein
MRLRTFFILAALAAAVPACTVYTVEVGSASSDGTVYLGFNLFSAKGKSEREAYPIGQEHGPFSTLRLKADKAVAISRVTVVFADGERFNAPISELAGGQWSAPIALPGGPRPIHSVVIVATSRAKGLASIEVYGNR